MTKRRKALTLLLGVFLLGFVFGILLGRSCTPGDRVSEGSVPPEAQCTDGVQSAASCGDEADAGDEASEDDVDGTGKAERREIIYYADRLPYAKLFADMNPAHVEMARKVGLGSVPGTREELKGMKGLVKIEDSDDYVVDNLTYSMPYLTPGAARELGAIAEAFCDSLRAKDLLDYKLVVSSLLRTEEDVARLRRSGNPNASDNSAHCYGTTFDITYTRYFRENETDEFMQPYELTKVLGEVLRERKKAGKCLVKYERKEHCFHITSCY